MIGHAGVYQWGTFMRGPEQIFLDMAMNPDLAHAIFDQCVAFELEFYERILEAGKGCIDIVQIFDDYGSQSGVLFSTEMWREFFVSNTKKLTDLAHSYGAFFMQHSCGAVSPIIPELIACGVDILDPIQKVHGMEPETLKRNFGERLTFHGGIDTQFLLPHASPEEVTQETARFMEVLGQNGGYILSGSQWYLADTPLENLLAIYRTPRT